MARLWSSGAESNSTTLEGTVATGAVSIDTVITRKGSYAFKCAPTGSAANFRFQFKTGNTNGRFFYRVYFYIDSLPNVEDKIFWCDDTQTNGMIGIRLETNGTLQLWNEAVVTPAQIGSPSSALSTGIWYRLELDVDTTTAASTVVKAYVATGDGTATLFASGTVDTSNHGGSQAIFGWGARNNVTATYHIDDVGVNDSTGSFQNSLLGVGQIIHLHPNAAGDNAQWTIGGSAPAATNYQGVNEVTPDDGVTLNTSNTLNQTDDFNIDNTPISIGSSDTISVVQVGARFNGVGSSANAGFKLRCKKTSGGTVSSSGQLIPSGTTYKTNQVVTPPATYPLTLYQDPDSVNWTKATLDTAQIGYILSATNTNGADISTIWMLVESIPTVAPATAVKSQGFGVGGYNWPI